MITFVNLMCKGNTISPTTQFVEAEFTKRGNNVRFLKFTFAFRYIFIIFASNFTIVKFYIILKSNKVVLI